MPKRLSSSLALEAKRIASDTNPNAPFGFLSWLCRDIQGLVLCLLTVNELPVIMASGSPFTQMALDSQSWCEQIIAYLTLADQTLMARRCISIGKHVSEETRSRVFDLIWNDAEPNPIFAAVFRPNSVLPRVPKKQAQLVLLAHNSTLKLPRTKTEEKWHACLSMAISLGCDRAVGGLLARRGRIWYTNHEELCDAGLQLPEMIMTIARATRDEQDVVSATFNWMCEGQIHLAQKNGQGVPVFAKCSRGIVYPCN